ncbi:MAG: hypothetical protein M1822_005993 [Bathelium mastoideum]|nr:MAG: hypothetical protein M1822_005993 [Bathelium mastoideum]
MTSKTFRRLAAEHNSLHTEDLPPNYLFPPNADSFPDDLTQLEILLAGPHGTPYADGVWRLYLDMPKDYPASPPKAFFRTRIWHPNVEEATGSVCVDTLKRDWQSKLTLRDVLITISCLLIYPNPASALNAEAGALLQEDFHTFSKRAKLMTSIHAGVPSNLKSTVAKAKRRGEEDKPSEPQTYFSEVSRLPTPPLSSAGSGLGIQGCSFTEPDVVKDDDDSKENDASLFSMSTPSRPQMVTPHRLGPPVPLGELEIPHDLGLQPFCTDTDDFDTEMTFSSEQNIKNNKPPQDNKNPSGPAVTDDSASYASQSLFAQKRPLPLSPLFSSISGPSTRPPRPFRSPIKTPTRSSGLTPHLSTWGSVSKPRAMSPPKPAYKGTSMRAEPLKRLNRELLNEQARKRQAFEDRLWRLAGGDIHRYNRGDFGPKKTAFDRI